MTAIHDLEALHRAERALCARLGLWDGIVAALAPAVDTAADG